MARHGFVLNLRTETFQRCFRQPPDATGFLLAANRATPGMLGLSAQAAGRTWTSSPTTGTFELIAQTAARFGARAAEVLTEVRRVEEALGRRVRREDLPDSVRAQATDLAWEVRQFTRELAGDGDRNREAQLAIDPSHLIGVEDISMATWLALDLEPTYLDVGRGDNRQQNEAVARHAVERLGSFPVRLASKYYPVASAVDHNTASGT